jgi:hypothetical protein
VFFEREKGCENELIASEQLWEISSLLAFTGTLKRLQLITGLIHANCGDGTRGKKQFNSSAWNAFEKMFLRSAFLTWAASR